MSAELARLEREHGWRIAEHAELRDGVWEAPEGPAEPVHYRVEQQQPFAAIEARSPWFEHRNRIVLRLLERGGSPQGLWEVGAGNGFVAAAIERAGVPVVTVEPLGPGAVTAARRGLTSLRAQLEQLELPAGSLPAIGLFDVLEHLERPEGLLAEVHRVLAPGGDLLVTVPALGALWSGADEQAQHQRRYSRRALDRLLTEAGFQRQSLRYAFGTMLLPVLALRTLPYRLGLRRRRTQQAELAPHGRVSRLGWTVLLAVERALERTAGPPLGTSLAGRYRRDQA